MTYMILAIIISVITTIILLAFVYMYFEEYESGPDARRENARRVLACTLGYVLAFTWPVTVPVLFLIGLVYFILQASPSNVKE